MPITGRWRCAWKDGPEYEFVDVGPCDVVSFLPGVARRFMNVTEREPDTEHLLLFVVALRRRRHRSRISYAFFTPVLPNRHGKLTRPSASLSPLKSHGDRAAELEAFFRDPFTVSRSDA
jgi:hypothetical protein